MVLVGQVRHLSQSTKSKIIVLDSDETEFPENYVLLLQLENISIESLANKTVTLDDAGADKNLKAKVEDCNDCLPLSGAKA